MTSIDTILLNRGVHLRGAPRWLFLEYTVLYMFRGISATQYKQKIRKHIELEHIMDIKADILNNGYLMKNVKLWLFAKANGEKGDFQIKKEDLPLASLLKVPKVRALLLRLGKKYKAFRLAHFDKVTDAVLSKLNRVGYIDKFVNRKMKFIRNAQSLETSDIALDIVCESLGSLYHWYPCYDNQLHFMNLFKKFIHNYGINYIKTYTTDKRSRIQKNKDGTFFNNTSDLSVAIYDESNVENLSTNFRGDVTDSTDLRLGVNQVMKSLSDKRRRFVQLLMGMPDEGFTEFLLASGIKLSNEDLLDKCLKKGNIDKYVRLSLKYLNVSSGAGERFLESLRLSFKEYSVNA